MPKNKQEKQEEHPGLIETDDIINVLFESKDESIEEETSENEKISKLENKLNEYIQAQDNIDNESEESSLIEEEEFVRI